MSVITNFVVKIFNKEKIEEKIEKPLDKATFDKLIEECKCPDEKITSKEIKALFEERNDNR